ncbi:MAG: alpha/beta hydrolase [Lentilitoribacter sp.]
MSTILFSSPGNPVPEDHKAGYFTGCDGRQLRYAVFRSTGQNAKGTIVLLHGRNECIEKYFETIKNLTDAGFWVATFDWRGQGGSERILRNKKRGFVRKFQHFEDDLKIFLEQVVLPDARMPFYALAHSMGGLILLSASPNIANRIDRIVLLAPFISTHVSGFKLFLTTFLLALLNGIGLGSLPIIRRQQGAAERFNILTSDEKRYVRNDQIYKSYPEFETGVPSIKWLYLMFKAMKRVNKQEHLERITIPTIVMGGSHDGIVPFEAFEDVSTKFRAGQLIPFDGARHELMTEVDIYREPTLAATIAFFTKPEDD